MRATIDLILAYLGLGLFGVCVVMLFLPTAWTHDVSWPIFCAMLASVGAHRILQFYDEMRDLLR